MESIGGIIALIALIGIIGAVIWSFSKKREQEKLAAAIRAAEDRYQRAIKPFYAMMRENYYHIYSKLSIPSDAVLVDMEATVFGLKCKAIPAGKSLENLRNNFYMWFENDTIYIFPTPSHLEEDSIRYATHIEELASTILVSDIRLIKIPLDDIVYFIQDGGIETEVRSYGGQVTESGVNIGGAIVGGLLFGELGAFYGGMPETKVEPTTTQILKFDVRYTKILYKDHGTVKTLKLSITAYPYLEKWIPEKCYEYASIMLNEEQSQIYWDAVKKFESIKAKFDDTESTIC